MPIRIVTDSSANLDPQLAAEHDITVIGLHTLNQGTVKSTAGLSALELVACYARQLERGNDAGVIAIHLSKELSSTWNNAVTAAGVFPDTVSVLDTSAIGMNLGAAAIAAAEKAAAGGSVADCRQAAQDVLRRASLFLYVHRIDDLRKSGRMSAAVSLMSTALAIRPILTLNGGKLEIAAKTRTQSKALDKLAAVTAQKAGDYPAQVWLQHYQAEEAAQLLHEELTTLLPEGSSVSTIVMDPALAVHCGPGSLAVTVVVDERALVEEEPVAPPAKKTAANSGLLGLLKQDPAKAAATQAKKDAAAHAAEQARADDEADAAEKAEAAQQAEAAGAAADEADTADERPAAKPKKNKKA